MGLVFAEGKYTTLTDILGAEDAFGDMDFKVAGTSEFVTALQLDTKIEGIPADVLAQALDQAKDARLQILEVMAARHRRAPLDEVGETAPKIVSFEIPMDKIGEVIGPKGKVINAIQQETGADISVDDDGSVGRVSIGSTDSERSPRPSARSSSSSTRRPPRSARPTRAGSSTSPSSVRSSTSSRAVTACSTSPRSAAASASTGSRTSSTWATRSRSASTTSTPTARCRCAWPAIRPRRSPVATVAIVAIVPSP